MLAIIVIRAVFPAMMEASKCNFKSFTRLRGLVKSRVEFPPAQIRWVFLNYAFTSAREFRIG